MLYKNRNVQLFLLSVLLLPILSSCWDSQEIDERANVLAIGIDVADKQEEKSEDEIAHLRDFSITNNEIFKLTAQIAIPGRIPLGPEQTGGKEKPVLVVQVVGHTIEDAIINLQQEVANELFLGHLRIIVLNEKVAKQGTQRFNDFLRRNPEIRRTASLVVSKESAATYLKVSPELERIPSLYLADMVDNLTALGKFPPSFIGLFWTILSSKGQDAYLPYFRLKKGDNLELNGLAYFKGDKMVGKTNPADIGIFMSVKGIHRGGYGAFVKVPGTNEVVVVKAMSRRTKIKVSLKDGKPHASIKISYESTIDEKGNPKLLVSNSSLLKKVEKQASKDVVASTKKFIKRTQRVKSDVFGFGEHFRAKLPHFWNKKIGTKEKWEDYYQQLTFDLQVETHIHRVGMKAK
ncbi:Ger(x)C family spore germination protein [Neobacillus jeddahensis]|uniref:Ger(x)C family spore germination protein n=1 Tax=Neobacillus jeddahensis TaxID=1461580 RepID=UPI00058E67C8|nr:Ger(x)C family spore germination protein [Neobacillus jeddahensis]